MCPRRLLLLSSLSSKISPPLDFPKMPLCSFILSQINILSFFLYKYLSDSCCAKQGGCTGEQTERLSSWSCRSVKEEWHRTGPFPLCLALPTGRKAAKGPSDMCEAEAIEGQYKNEASLLPLTFSSSDQRFPNPGVSSWSHGIRDRQTPIYRWRNWSTEVKVTCPRAPDSQSESLPTLSNCLPGRSLQL